MKRQKRKSGAENPTSFLFPPSIIIDRETLRFTALHWVKYRPTVVETAPDGSITIRREDIVVVEPLHEHTFRVKLEIAGALDEFGCVIDFALAEQIMVKILQQFDHKILIPADDPDLTLRKDGDQIQIGVLNSNWGFQERNVKFLPATNASTETIAAIILAEFLALVQKSSILPKSFSDDHFVLSLEENRGMSARVESRGQE